VSLVALCNLTPKASEESNNENSPSNLQSPPAFGIEYLVVVVVVVTKVITIQNQTQNQIQSLPVQIARSSDNHHRRQLMKSTQGRVIRLIESVGIVVATLIAIAGAAADRVMLISTVLEHDASKVSTGFHVILDRVG
jgi:hypothetical protein